MLNKKHLITLFTLLFLTSLSCWLIFHSNQSTLQPFNPNTPSAFMTNVHEVKLNQSGKPQSILISPKLVNFVKHNITNIEKPLFILFSQTEPPWHINANHGQAINGTQKIILWDQVKMHQLPGVNSRNITLTTSKMTIYPQKSLAETDQPVTITEPDGIIHAIGLEANINKGTVKLLSKVKGQYHNKGSLDSDSVLINYKTNTNTYIGHVIATTPDTRITGNQAITQRNKFNKISSIINVGNPATYHSIPDQSKPPLDAKAQKIRIYPQKHQVQLTTKAFIRRGNTTLEGNDILIQRNIRKQITAIIVHGNPAHYHTPTEQNKPPLDASAKTIQYYPLKHLALLIEDGFAKQGANTITGPLIRYDTQQHIIQSTSSKKGRTHITINKKDIAIPITLEDAKF